MIWIGYIVLTAILVLFVLYVKHHVKLLIQENRRIKTERERIKTELEALEKRELVFKSRANTPGYNSRGEPIIRHIAMMFY